MTSTVSNAAELAAALDKAKAGSTIILKAGNYGDFGYSSKSFASAVTLKSDESGKPAVFTSFVLSNVSGLNVDGVKFDYRPPAGTPDGQTNFMLKSVSNVTISNSVFDGADGRGLGPAYDGYGIGIGLSVRDSERVTIKNNEFTNFHRGAAFGSTNGLKVVNNELHDMSGDGLDFADVDKVLIKGNRIHDFHRPDSSTAHPDFIQFWTSGTNSPSVNVKILNNFLYQGEGIETQSIFMRNELVDTGTAGAEMFYRNILIAGNVIKNSHYHGITVGETAGLEIKNNTILQNEKMELGGTVSVPSVNVSGASTGVSVHDNILPRMGGALPAPPLDWLVENNFIVQVDNPRAANYAGYVFADGLDRNPEWQDFAPIGKALVKFGDAGAVHSKLAMEASGTAAPGGGPYWGYISAAEHDANGHLAEYFQVTKILQNFSAVDLAGTAITWDFGDGTDGHGRSVGHVYDEPGEYIVTASIALPSGKTLELERTVEIRSANLLQLDFENGLRDRSPHENAVKTSDGVTLVQGARSQGLRLDGGFVSYQSDGDFVFNPEFTIAADFKKSAGSEDKGGWLLSKSGSFNISVGADKLLANLVTSKGTVTLEAAGVGITDTDWHRLSVSFSGADGVARLILDGHIVDTARGLAGAILVGSPGVDLVLGSPFGGSFTGQIDNVCYIGDSLSAKETVPDDMIAAWMSLGEMDPVVRADAGGVTSVDLSDFLSNREIADAFLNSHFGLFSDTGLNLL